jgi:arylsulfatase A-like enzyme
VSQVDLSPTLIAAAGAPVPSSMQGHSFLSLANGGGRDWRNEVYFRMSEFVTGRALRTPQHTYAVSTPKRAGWRPAAESDSFVEYMLYDLFADPFQHTNLAGRTGSRAVEERLRGELLKRIGEAGGQHPAIELRWFPYSKSQVRRQACIHSFLITTPNPGAWGSGM